MQQHKIASVKDIESCSRGCLHGIEVWDKDGAVKTKLCACTENLPAELMNELKGRAGTLRNCNIPPRFADSSYAGKTFREIVPSVLLKWLDAVCYKEKSTTQHRSIFLCGNVGNGKTHLATDCIKRFVIATGKRASYLPVKQLVDIKKDAVTFAGREFLGVRHRLDGVKQAMIHNGLVVIDEITASLSEKEVSYLEEFIDIRHRAGLPTIFISNHTFVKKTSYNGITIEQVVGKRNADRMRASLYHEFNAPSWRRVTILNDCTENKEEDMFCLPKSVLAQHKKGMNHILNWMTRNAIIENIRDDQRKIAANPDGSPVILHGVPKDEARDKLKISHDLWQKGDVLTMEGPILGYDDAKTYISCLDLLALEHQRGNYGLSIRLSLQKIMSVMGKKSRNSDNRVATHRSLRRISSANINYVDNLGREWIGPLFNFFYQPYLDGGSYLINFNKSMITFYETFEYTKIPPRIFGARIGTDGLRMQMFLRSHANKLFDGMNFDRWMEFLEKSVNQTSNPEDVKRTKRKIRKSLSETIRRQIHAGLLTQNSTMKRDGRVVLEITSL